MSAVDALSNGAEATVALEAVVSDMAQERLSTLARPILLEKRDFRGFLAIDACPALTVEVRVNEDGHVFSSLWSRSICGLSRPGPWRMRI